MLICALQSPVAALRARSSPSGGGARKPSGPRPIAGSGSYKKVSGGDGMKRTRFRGSPNQIDSDEGEEDRYENVVTKW